MKSTGIIRQIDQMGRIVLPAELRRSMDIGKAETMEIFVDGDTIILKKYHPACIFCDSSREIVRFKGKTICTKCLRQLRAAPEGQEAPESPAN